MKRIRIERTKVRKEHGNEPLPLDPRDPDILRAKRLIYAREARPRATARGSTSSERSR
jgi:hypothetical protein